MKKKLIVILLALILPLSLIFADFDYQLELFSFDPLYKEYMADKNKPELALNLSYYADGFPEYILQDDIHGSNYEDYFIEKFHLTRPFAGAPFMVEINLGETISVLRHTFTFDHWLSPISFDFSWQGAINWYMEGEFADTIGYDGVYFFGLTMRIADVFSFRFGAHHYCSHYGDAVWKRIPVGQLKDFWVTYKYERMDTLDLGLSVEPLDFLRVYFDINFPVPGITTNLRPWIFAPSWLDQDGKPNNPYPDSYNALIINFGIELSYPIFKNLGDTTIAYDCHLFQDGKINYSDPDHIFYDKNKPWDVDHTLTIAQEFNEWISLEISYHNGRAPFNNMYFQHVQYVSVGVRYNPDAAFTLYDSAK